MSIHRFTKKILDLTILNKPYQVLQSGSILPDQFQIVIYK